MVETPDYGLRTTDHGLKSLIKQSLFISILLHASLLGLLIFGLPGDVERPAGEGQSEIISVSLVSKGTGYLLKQKNMPARLSTKPQEQNLQDNSTSIRHLLGGEGGTSTILQQIRNKIERNKYYPLMAKRSKTEGSPLIEFKIKEDGSLEYVSLKKSSGFKVLDEAAAATVHQAAPFPFYPEPIALNIHYTLAR